MATYEVKDSELDNLRGKTVLIIGAASGIGRATVALAHGHGANIAIGDWNSDEGAAFANELAVRAIFRKCDMSNWDDIVALFEAAWESFGQIDIVLANAGIHTEGNWVDDAVNSSPGQKLLPPDMNTIRVNLDGTIYVTKCAMHYFARRRESKTQLVFTGSAASFLETPPLHQYCASKSGILGLMRSLRSRLPSISNTTVNMVAPWQTYTAMTSDRIREVWGELPSNTPAGVGRALLLPALRPDLNGLALFVHGDQITDLEEGLVATMPQWMGPELANVVNEGQRRILQ